MSPGVEPPPRPRLAPWACDPERSRGRRFPETSDPLRDAFQRDRDRIVHSTAFRRLVYKTQVFVNHEGDLYRTRLTHSLEVAQLGRSVAQVLRLNEALVEAIALAHDLGHTPFGHAGQDALNDCMRGHGGFEHNLQSLRVVDHLEARYPAFDGLNLSFETREGILKHCSRRNAAALEAGEPSGVAARFLLKTQPSLEAQLTGLADEIAYNAHDVDDGLRSGLLTWADLAEVPLVRVHQEQAMAEHPGLADRGGRRLQFEVVRRMLSAQIHDLMAATSQAVQASGVASEAEVRAAAPLVGFSPVMRRQVARLKRFLYARLYRHPRVTQTMDAARSVVTELFAAYLDRPAEMPPDFACRDDLHRAVADYVSGMTDRFAAREHQRLTGRSVFAAA